MQRALAERNILTDQPIRVLWDQKKRIATGLLDRERERSNTRAAQGPLDGGEGEVQVKWR